MKKLLTYLLILVTTGAVAQDARYMTAMQNYVTILDSTVEVSALQNANNAFERIGNANPKEWLPLYYQAYCNVMIGMNQEDNAKKDEFFDHALQFADKADQISPDNSEIYVMKSWINSMKISVDPANRGRQYGMQASMLTAKAIELDKENPRAYLLRGTGLLYTPPQFGGGKDKAMPVLEEAVVKFKNFKPSSPIMPHWGEARANEVLEQCKKEK